MEGKKIVEESCDQDTYCHSEKNYCMPINKLKLHCIILVFHFPSDVAHI